jgi:hypothetical protein
MLTNMSRMEQLLSDPAADISLDELKVEINELAKLRDNSRGAFCKRLALVYMILVGRPFGKSEPRDGASAKFFKWCAKNIRTANGKIYSSGTLSAYLRDGFSSNPMVSLKQRRDQSNHRSETMRKLGSKLDEAIKSATPPKVVPITQLRSKYKLPTDVAQEVNQLMRAWEQASSEARAQFIYMVTGKRVNAA